MMLLQVMHLLPQDSCLPLPKLVREFSVNIDEKLAAICCVGTQEIINNMKSDATRICKYNIQCIVVN